jgi:multidrug resistance efflux pump
MHSHSVEEAKTTYFEVEKKRSESVALVRASSLCAHVREPGAKSRTIVLDKPWVTIGGGDDDIALADRTAGPGQIVLRMADSRVFLECSPMSSGVRLAGAVVYRAILAPGDKFRIGRAEVAIGDRNTPAPQSALALVRAQPQIAKLVQAIAAVRTQPRPRRIALLAGTLAILGLVCTTRVTVSADCEIVPQARGFVRTPVAGFVKSVKVREGERVHKGDLLAIVAVPDVERDIARVRHEIEAARAQLAQAERGARPTELLMAQARERAAHTKSLYLLRQRDRVARLAKQGLESRQALDDANRDAETAQAEAELAQLAVAHVEQGSAPEEIEQKRAELAKLEGERDFLVKQRGHAELVSPADGVVATPRLSELESKFVAPGTELMVVLDGRQMVFEVKVPEKEIEFVRAGAPVRLRLKGDPQHPVEGVVEEIAPRVEEGPLGRVVPVRCRAAEVPPAALAGLSGAAQIEGPRTSWVGLLSKRIYRWVRTDLL